MKIPEFNFESFPKKEEIEARREAIRKLAENQENGWVKDEVYKILLNKTFEPDLRKKYLTDPRYTKTLNRKTLNLEYMKAWPDFTKKGFTPVQEIVTSCTAKYVAFIAGRRTGKTTAAARVIIEELLIPNRKIWIVAPDMSRTEMIFNKVYNVFLMSDLRVLVNEKEGGKIQNTENRKRIITSHPINSSVECKTAANEKGLVGESLDLVVFDEAGLIDDYIFEIITPSLSDRFREGKILAVGTPRAGDSFFRKLYELGQDPNETRYASFNFTSFDNEYVSINDIKDEWIRKPYDLFMQEIAAKFLESGGEVFKYDPEKIFLPPRFRVVSPGETLYVGIDVAKTKDYTVISIFNDIFEMVDFERLNVRSWEHIEKTIKQKLEKYIRNKNILIVSIDRTSWGNQMAEQLQKYFLYTPHITIYPVQFTSIIKNQLVEDLKIRLETGRITLWDLPEIERELKNFTFKTTPSGNIKYEAKSGEHDDIISSLLLVINSAQRGRVMVFDV